MDVEGGDMQIGHHHTYALRWYLLFLVDMSMFVDKRATYIDEVYLQYFINLIVIHEYNLEPACIGLLVLEARRELFWKTKQMTRSYTLFMVIYCY